MQHKLHFSTKWNTIKVKEREKETCCKDWRYLSLQYLLPVNLTRTQHNKWNCFLEGNVPLSRFPHLFNPPSTFNPFSFNWRTMLSGENIFSQIELSQIMGDCNTTQQNTVYVTLKIGKPSVNVGTALFVLTTTCLS